MAVNEIETDVVIIGGGAVGLCMSANLSNVAAPIGPIRHHLFEKHTSTAIHPKATAHNQRTLEICRKLGIEDDIYTQGASRKNSGRVGWYTCIGQESSKLENPYKHLLGTELLSRDAVGYGRYEERYSSASPSYFTSVSQRQTEPVLLRRARELAGPETKIELGTEVVKVIPAEHAGELSSVILRDGTTVKTKYVVVADGGRSCAEALGVKVEGRRNLFDMVTAHFVAPDFYSHMAKLGLEGGHNASENYISFFVNPELKGSRASGLVRHLGPYDKDLPEDSPKFGHDWEWDFVFAFAMDDPERFNKDSIIPKLRSVLNIPDLDIEIKSVTHWNVQSIIADTFTLPRRSLTPNIFIVGDAAHRIAPSGGLGVNMGMQDTMNLAWKLALAIHSPKDYSPLLGSYNTERRPLAITVAKHTVRSFDAHESGVDAAIGVSRSKTAKENWEAVRILKEDPGEEGRKKREALLASSDFLDNEFAAQGVESGYHYYEGALALEEDDEVIDAMSEAERRPLGLPLPKLVYVPKVKAGHFLPHAWVQSAEGEKISTIDIVKSPRFALLTSPRSKVAWKKAVHSTANPLAKFIDVFSIAPRTHFKKVDADFVAIDDQWAPYDVGTGAILVRPDTIVAWVTRHGEQDKKEVLDRALQNILS